MLPSAPKSARMVSPFCAQTTRVNEPASTRWPALERRAEAAELVGEPRDAHRRMTEHAGRDAGLLDLGIAHHQPADPAQVDVHRADRPPADHDAGRRAIVRDRVEDFSRIDETRIDDFDGGHDIFGRAQHVGQADARPLSCLPSTKASSISTRGAQ